jgi:hypothetical protein
VPTDDDPGDPRELRLRAARYAEAGLLGKAAMRLSRESLTPAQREQVRRHDLGPEGRIAEDVVRLVDACVPIWSLLAEKGLPEDLTVRELNAIWECLLGRTPGGWVEPNAVDVSLKFTRSPLHVTALRRVVPGMSDEDRVDAYRYATLRTRAGPVEPFVIALRTRDAQHNDVVATMLVAATFLRHEEDLGAFTGADLEPLEDVLAKDLAGIAETHIQLQAAPPT